VEDRVPEIAGLDSESGLILGDFSLSPDGARSRVYLPIVRWFCRVAAVLDDFSFCGNKEISRAIDVESGPDTHGNTRIC
jgi:hypothetical protein